MHQLILGIHDHREAVLREFIMMAGMESSSTNHKIRKNTTSTVVQFLGPRFLGILGFLDEKLNSVSTVHR